ncbi:hypothetical protein VTJ04DRAFT_9198 [Mycothermus thermophilus]|uniref:uncharacterized protein n=1 Tax=Humicola insolens TaxID=85995 RepID=UPI0037440697
MTAAQSQSHALPSTSASEAVAKLSTLSPGDAPPTDSDPAEAYESQHVHAVYEAIAPHFSATRHKPWPAVASFLRAQPPGAVGLDVGCGNGKYLGVNGEVYMVASDRSAALVGLARERLWRKGTGGEGAEGPGVGTGTGTGGEGNAAAATATATPGAANSDLLIADGLSLPFRPGAADFAICIAVIHHLSTRARRQDAIRQLLGCVKPNGAGKVLLYVWALEQGTSRRGWDEGSEQDLLVPWVLKAQEQKKQPKPKQRRRKGEEQEQEQGQGQGGDSGPAAEGAEERHAEKAKAGNADPVFQRYYHLYRKGELEEDVIAAGGVVVESGYERDNWWVVASNPSSG